MLRPHLVALTLIALAALAAFDPATAGDAPPPCEGFQDHPGQGPSRQRADGLWEVCLRDGSTILSHGPDGPATDLPAAPPGNGGTSPRAPPCVDDATLQHHMQAIYAVPANKADRYSTKGPEVRDNVHMANGKLHEEAQEFGFGVEYRFLCDANGEVVVSHAVLPTSSSSDSFSSIASDLRAQGFNDPLVQYWVWYDDGVNNYCGQGTISADSSLRTGNLNNRGDRFGITYGCSWTTMMHESGHNLGAVQNNAPNASGGWHCNDEQDIMCYNDGGSSSGTFTACSDKDHFDCNHDDYFHPDPPPGNHLHSHWNLGSPLNRFITHSAVPAPAGPVQDLEVDDGEIALGIAPLGSSKVLTWDPPATGVPVTDYLVYRTDPDGNEVLRARLNGEITRFNDPNGNLPSSGEYLYRVTTINAAGIGASATVTAHHTQV